MSTIFSKIIRKQCLHACDFFHVCCWVDDWMKMTYQTVTFRVTVTVKSWCHNNSYGCSWVYSGCCRYNDSYSYSLKVTVTVPDAITITSFDAFPKVVLWMYRYLVSCCVQYLCEVTKLLLRASCPRTTN